MAEMVAASSAEASWTPEEWAAFPPLYTLQPNAETRRQQLKVWVDLVHDWSRRTGTSTFAPASCGVFRNDEIKRSLDAEGVAAVVDAIVGDGRGEVVDGGMLFLLAARPRDVAAAVYDWARAGRKLGGVFTVLELYDGADESSPVHGADPRLVFKALEILEAEDKAEVFHGATSTDAGVKFYADNG